jgi:hypothetical protein
MKLIPFWVYAHALDVAKPATHPDGQVLAKAKVHAQAESPVHPAVTASEPRYEHRVSVRYEGRFGPFNSEPPAKAEADREVVRIRPVRDVGAEAKGERAIQREASRCS